jgi:hypothetical protein
MPVEPPARQGCWLPPGVHFEVGVPGSLVGMDAAMRSPLHPPRAALRPPRPVGRAGSDLPVAELRLGTSHPLVRLLRQLDTAFEQAVSVTAVQTAGFVFWSGGLRFGLALAIAGMVVQAGLGCRLAALRAGRRELCLELIIGGREALPLSCIDRERRRLLDRRTLKQLATSLDDMSEIAARPLPVHSAVRPIFYACVVRQVTPELRELASLLGGDAPCVRGVAAVQWLLTSPASPLYGVEVEPLRRELGRARYLLSLTP